jgi:hypothetical protein
MIACGIHFAIAFFRVVTRMLFGLLHRTIIPFACWTTRRRILQRCKNRRREQRNPRKNYDHGQRTKHVLPSASLVPPHQSCNMIRKTRRVSGNHRLPAEPRRVPYFPRPRTALRLEVEGELLKRAILLSSL